MGRHPGKTSRTLVGVLAMKLSELNPKLTEGILVFDCPCGQCGGKIRVQVGSGIGERDGKPVWQISGNFPEITLTPSVRADPCWHGNIEKGEMVTAKPGT